MDDHRLRRESIKNASSASAIGVQSVRPTWFEDFAVPKGPTLQTDQGQPQPLHGLKLVIKEEVLPMKDQPEFPALALLASRGLLAPDAWKCKRAQVSLKATIDVPMLGTIIEQNGDGLLEDSHMPVGWPLHIDGAVRQCCIHRSATLQELDDMLSEYDMKRDSVEINHNAPQWSHNTVWNRKYMEPKTGYTLRQLWADSEPAIGQKSSPSYEVKDGDIRRAVAAIADLPSSTLHDSPFILALGTPAAQNVRPGPRLNTSIPDLVPVQRMNARIPVPMWLSQQPWSTDRIEYNWLQRMHLLTNSLCTATLMLVHGTSAEHSV